MFVLLIRVVVVSEEILRLERAGIPTPEKSVLSVREKSIYIFCWCL